MYIFQFGREIDLMRAREFADEGFDMYELMEILDNNSIAYNFYGLNEEEIEYLDDKPYHLIYLL